MVLPVLAVLLLPPEVPPSPSPDVRFREQVEVSRVVLDARVVDGRGEPRRQVDPGDLRLVVDGREVPVESVQWVADGAPVSGPHDAPPAAVPSPAEAAPSGRCLVLLFQKDLDGSRAPGLLRMVQRARELVRGLGPGDRVAVLSFDTRLHLWLDLSGDHERAARAIEGGVVWGRPEPGGDGDGSLLRDNLDPRSAARADSLERSLDLVGRALLPLPGPKSLVVIGHGTGRGGLNYLWLGDDWDDALRSLAAARVSVFTFDVTDADQHQLQFALEAVAADTGGFYAKTHEAAGAAMARLRGALAGRQVIAFVRPDLPPGFHRVRVELRHGDGEVLVPPGYVD